jgi:hypothetical protein
MTGIELIILKTAIAGVSAGAARNVAGRAVRRVHNDDRYDGRSRRYRY